MAFHFRHFSICDDQSTLRVGTDAMLLGAWANPGNAMNILDIGTGCGVLALMVAQRSDAIVDAIDSDLPSVEEAHLNFRNSPWPSRLHARHITLQDFAPTRIHHYDYILTNPPYFSNSLKSPSVRKNAARHDTGLRLAELIRFTAQMLKPQGKVALILPTEISSTIVENCAEQKLFVHRRLSVSPKPGAVPIRELLEFTSFNQCQVVSEGLTLRNNEGKYTDEYLVLTKSYHNF